MCVCVRVCVCVCVFTHPQYPNVTRSYKFYLELLKCFFDLCKQKIKNEKIKKKKKKQFRVLYKSESFEFFLQTEVKNVRGVNLLLKLKLNIFHLKLINSTVRSPLWRNIFRKSINTRIQNSTCLVP